MNSQEALTLARELMNQHSLNGWNLSLDRATRRFGCTDYGTMTISLSKALVELNEWETVKKTVIHEIAHALVGSRHGHDDIWRAKAISLGHSGSRCYSAVDVVTPPMKYVGTCPKCGKQTQKNRRQEVACGKCCKAFNGGVFSHEFKLVWTENKEALKIAA